MFQRDFMLNEVRKFAELLARLVGLKTEGRYEEYHREFDAVMQKEYNAELEDLLALNEDDFIDKLRSAGYSAEKLNALSQLLYVFAQPFKTETEPILQKVLIIFELLEQKHHYQSFENIDKQKAIYKYFEQK
jgi:hypothetical protein